MKLVTCSELTDRGVKVSTCTVYVATHVVVCVEKRMIDCTVYVYMYSSYLLVFANLLKQAME